MSETLQVPPQVYGAHVPGRLLDAAEVRGVLQQALAPLPLAGRRVLLVVPDGTRTMPMPLFFRQLYELVTAAGASLDVLVALGTHQPMSPEALRAHLGMSGDEQGVTVFNHEWSDPATFVTLDTITQAETLTLSGGRLALDVPVRINRLALAYDLLIVCGPVFPHEVAGFSGGSKYFFPGISGSEVINFTHWLGALITSYRTIGRADTPVRAVIERAAAAIPTPHLYCCPVVSGQGVAGLYMGDALAAWRQAVALSARLHVAYAAAPYRQVLSVMPEMYDDLWTAAKGMYKLEPVVADGGEVIIYAPHIDEVSYTHGRILDEIGYHVRDYFVAQWERFKDYPWGVLAHSTHLRGMGTYENGVERARIRVTLATAIPAERCARLGLGYRDPRTIQPEAWAGREAEGVLLVPHAGETLYLLKEDEQQNGS